MDVVERAEQLAAVEAWLSDAARGHGRLVYVCGEAGVGKTTLVRAAVERADGRARVALAGCDGSATPSALAPLAELATQLPGVVWSPDRGRHELFAAFLDVLRAAEEGPILVVVEDVHWADEATLDLVRHLARRVDTCHALVLVTYRGEEVPATTGLRVLLGDTASASGVRRIDVAGLTSRAVADLAAAHAREHPDSPPVDPVRLHAVTGGNAFFVTEVLRGGSAGVPPTVRDAVLARVARLPEGAQRAIEVVALAGARVEAGLVEGLLADGLAALDEPLARGLLVERGGELAFRHELGRLAVLGEVPVGRRLHVHRRLLAALREVEADPARIAHHADAAGDSAVAVEFASLAGDHAARLGAHREAAAQYRRALDHAARLPDDKLDAAHRAALSWSLGYELYVTGRIEEAIASVEAARDIWSAVGDDLRVGDSWRCLSRLSWFAGRGEEAERLGAVAVEALSGPATTELGLALSNRAQLRMLSTDLEGTRTWGRRALDVAEALDEGPGRTEVRVHALTNLGTMEVVVGELARGTAMLTESLSAARDHELHEHAARAYCNLASSAVAQRRHADARRWLEEGMGYCTDRDLDSWTQYLRGWRAAHHLDRGEHAEAGRLAAEVLGDASVSSVGVVEPLVVLAHVRARLGEPEVAGLVARARDLADGMRELQRVAPVVALECELAWLRGDPQEAARLARAAWPVAEETDCPWNRGALARWMVDVRVAEAGPLAPPYAAEVAGDWAHAASIWADLESPFDRGLALARSGERDLLVEAVGVFEQTGARCAAARARAELRAHGWPAPRPPREPRVGTRAHPMGLTPREADVLDLLADGLSDAEIAQRLVISRRTAEHHVASILAKTGARGRRDLVGTQGGG
ncbi:ATP-binding protein [Oryzobacter sp. R7]|uniref:ATP-binding protein n=1 Tax=Oryzobacter faecalis TaxID=3388656 RepID=UPI00398C928C